MINFTVDDIVPCLKEVESGDLYNTEVIRMRRRSVLRRYNARTGWHVNWGDLADQAEVYALVLEGTNDIQGLVAIRYDDDAQAVHVVWACTAPQNNKWRNGRQRSAGVGGHLLAIASELSVRHGYDGYIYAEAVDKDLCQYYINEFDAVHVPLAGHPYRIIISGAATALLREVYSYVWTDDVD